MKTIGDRKFYTELDEIIAPSHTAVLVIDQQNDFCHSRGYYAQTLGLDVSMTQAINEPINRLTTAARSQGAMVIFAQYVIAEGFSSDSPMWLGIHAGAGLKALDQESFYTVEGTWGAELYEEMTVAADDHIIKKYRGSAFRNTSLEELLQSNGIETLIITGQVTEGCVENTIRAARDADFYTVLAKDAIGSTSKERHDRFMSGWLARAQCPDTGDIIDIWNGGA